jgi:hypothetical protein
MFDAGSSGDVPTEFVQVEVGRQCEVRTSSARYG